MGQMYAMELDGLNKLEAETEHEDMGESDSINSKLSASVAQCKGDKGCQHAVRDILLGEANSKEEEASCKDQDPKVCVDKKELWSCKVRQGTINEVPADLRD